MIPYFRAVLIDDNEKRNSTFTFIHLIVKICKNQITDYFRLFSILFFFKINSNASKLVIIHSIDVKAEKIWKAFSKLDAHLFVMDKIEWNQVAQAWN